MTEQLIIKQLEQLPEHLQREVLDFAGFLLEKYRAAPVDEVPAMQASASHLPGDYLHAQEIARRYPAEWILLADYKIEGTEIMGGRVLAHDADKRNLAMRAKDLALPEYPKTIFFTGRLPRRAKVGLMQKISS
jgi:hypothetical protein